MRARKIGYIEERDAEIDAREREIGRELQGPLESVRGLSLLELLQQCDAQIVCPVSVFARVRFWRHVLTMSGRWLY